VETEVGKDGEGVVTEQQVQEPQEDDVEPIVIEAITLVRVAKDIHFTRQEQKMVSISLPRVRWLERAEV
jgi:hypothetical protein